LTSLGVGRVYIVNAAKVEKSYWESSVVSEKGWRDFVITGLEQAVDTRFVDFEFHRGFKPFMTRVVPELRTCYAQMLVAHPGSATPLGHVNIQAGESILVAIGPEGGWNDFETDLFNRQGFRDFNIGTRILKVETAVTAIHAQLSLLQSLAERSASCSPAI